MSIERQTEKDNAADPVYLFFRSVSIIESLSRHRAERAMPDGMRMSHFSVLSHLVHAGSPSTPARLASAFQVTRPTMTNTLQKLESKAFIQIVAHPKDGRGKMVAITDKGRRAHDRAIEAITPLFANLVQDLGQELFAELLPGMTRVQQYLDEDR